MTSSGHLAIAIAATAELLYLLGLLTVRWWKTGVGRSRLLKALAFTLAVGAIAFVDHLSPRTWDALAWLLAVAASYQLGVFVHERWFCTDPDEP